MDIKAKLKASDKTIYNAQTAIEKAYAILNSLESPLSEQVVFDSRTFKPSFDAPGDLILFGEGVLCSQDLLPPATIEERLATLYQGSRLFKSTQDFVTGEMLTRSNGIIGVRYPVSFAYKEAIQDTDLLQFDSERDRVYCSISNWLEISKLCVSVLKAFAEASSAGYEAQVTFGNVQLVLRDADIAWFRHASGMGQLMTSTAMFTGLFQTAKEAELTIHGFRNGRSMAATLTDTARLQLMDYSFPCSGSVEFSEASCHFPLISKPGKILIERIWDLKSRPQLDLG